MKLRRLTAAFIIMATWLVAAPQVSAEPVTFENTPQILSAQDPPGGGSSVQGPGSPRIEIINDGDVTGTISDCGVIDKVPPVFSTNYPKTLAYVALGSTGPIICCVLEICCPKRISQSSCANPPCLPITTQTIPEPITITTFALGLGALQILVLRRRGRKRLPNRP